eukprot:scaffold19721_cov60-Phaeocystis_antarctica.AAC.3
MDTQHTHLTIHNRAHRAPWSATQLTRARWARNPLHWDPLIPARVFRTAVCEFVNRLLCSDTSTGQDRLNPGLVVALAVVPENLTPSGYRAAREYTHDEVRARLVVVAISFDHARLREGVCHVRCARLVGGRGGVSPEVDLARSYVDVWSDDDIVRVHLHGVARQLVASGGRQALKLDARAEGPSVHGDERTGSDSIGCKEPWLP